jgi:hypothetical protein
MKTSRSSWVILATIFAGMLLNWVAAIAQFQVNALFSDQWSFYTPLFQEAGGWTLFTWQHGPHRQGLAFVLTALVMEASGWDVRVESLWIVGCLAAATGLAVWLKYRLLGALKWTDAWIIISGLSLVQYETVVLVPNASHSVFPLLLLLVSAHAMVGRASVTKLLFVGLVGAVSMFTGFGLFVAVAILGYLVWCFCVDASLRVGVGVAVGLLIGAAILFGHGYVFSAASEGFQFPPDSIWKTVKFAGLMIASRMGMDSTGATAVGLGLGIAALIFGLLGWSWVRREKGAQAGRVIGIAMLVVGGGFVGFTALGRVHLGEIGAMASRYTILVVLIWWGLDMIVGGGVSRVRSRVITAMGWAMALGPGLTVVDRPVGTWIGTAGLRDGDLANLSAFEQRKLAWVAELLETGDWRAAEKRVPRGVFPFVETIDLDARLAWLEDRDLSFYQGGLESFQWMPWSFREPAVWTRPRSGGASRNTAAGARWILSGQAGGYWNVTFSPSSDATVELEWLNRRGEVMSLAPVDGVSIEASNQIAVLRLDGVRRARVPEWSLEPRYPLWSWNQTSWVRDRVLVIEDGFYGWEEGGRHGWTAEVLRARVVSNAPSFINVVIDSRFDPVAKGEVVVRLGDRSWTLSMEVGRVELSVPVRSGGTPMRFELINTAGAKSPAEVNLWDDQRPLALRLERLSIDPTADFPVPKPN